MTKSLTEKWKDKELEKGDYYVVIEWDDEIRKLYFEGDYFLDTDVPLDNDNIKEVLAPVPSYSEYQALKDNCDFTHTRLKGAYQKITQLEKKLEIATKALEELELKSDKLYRGGNDWSLLEQLDFIKARCQEVLYQIEEMEGVK